MNICSKLACLTILVSGPLLAQRRPDNTLMVQTFRANGDPQTGAKAADVLRDRLRNDFPSNKLSVPPTEQVLEYLLASDYLDSTTRLPEPLDATSERDLAAKFSADFYVTGDIRNVNGQYVVTPYFILTKESTQRQPLPVQSSKDIGDAMKNVSRSLRDVIPSADAAKKCYGDVIVGKAKEGLAVASAAIAQYPNGTLPRLCQQSIYFSLLGTAKTHADSLAYADSVLGVANAILRIDSVSVLPLQASVQLYKFKGDTANWLASVLKLAAATPNDAKMLQAVVGELALAGRFAEAGRLTQNMLTKSPDDPDVLQLAFNVYKNAKDWRNMVSVGARMASLDASKADSSYYLAMAFAYDTLHESQDAIALLKEATSRVHGNASLWFLNYKVLTKQGNAAGAKLALDSAVKYDPGYASLLFVPAQNFLRAKQYDSAYAALNQAVTSGGNAALADTLALGISDQLLREGSQSKDIATLQQSIKFSQLANKIVPSDLAQYYTGAAAFTIVQTAVGSTKKSCADAQTADNAYNIAVPALTAAKARQSNAGPMLTYLQQTVRPVLNSQLKQFCK